MRVKQLLAIGLLSAGFVLASLPQEAAGQGKFPTKPIQVIVAFQPGSTDIVLRPFMDHMPEYLGQPLSFVYKPGAAGSLGAGIAAAAKPDGYTVLGSTQSAMVILPLTHKDVTYTLDSFAPITCFVDSASLMMVQANARWKNLADFVAEAKNNPGMINFSSPGIFAIQHLLVEAFCKEAGIKLNHIPSQGGGPAVTALLGGHVDMSVGSLGTGFPHLKAGTLRALASFNEKRVRAIPEVPTVSESGFPVVSSLIFGILGPKRTPKEAIDTLHSAAKKVLENHRTSLMERYEKLGVEIFFLGPDEYAANLRKQSIFFEKVVKELKK